MELRRENAVLRGRWCHKQRTWCSSRSGVFYCSRETCSWRGSSRFPYPSKPLPTVMNIRMDLDVKNIRLSNEILRFSWFPGQNGTKKPFQICLTTSNKHHNYLNKPSQRQHTAWDHLNIHLITLAVGQRRGFWCPGFTYWASNDHEQHSNTDNSYGCRHAYKNKNVKERRDFGEAPDYNEDQKMGSEGWII